jgi:hypothetical protein
VHIVPGEAGAQQRGERVFREGAIVEGADGGMHVLFP